MLAPGCGRYHGRVSLDGGRRKRRVRRQRDGLPFRHRPREGCRCGYACDVSTGPSIGGAVAGRAGRRQVRHAWTSRPFFVCSAPACGGCCPCHAHQSGSCCKDERCPGVPLARSQANPPAESPPVAQGRDFQRGNLYRTSSAGPLPPGGVSSTSSPGCISSCMTVQQVGIEWPRAG